MPCHTRAENPPHYSIDHVCSSSSLCTFDNYRFEVFGVYVPNVGAMG
jgi:hypothetical protein